MILKFIFDNGLNMFRADLLSIIRGLNTVYAAIAIFYASYFVCLLVTAVFITSVTNNYYCVYIFETPDDGQ
jgi:hypothetical protein